MLNPPAVASPDWDPRLSHGTQAFAHANAALFAAGFATFVLLYAVQPLMPTFAASFGVSAAAASLSLSLTTAVLAGSLLVAGATSEAWGRKAMLVASLLAASVLTLGSAFSPSWVMFLASRALLGVALSGVPATAMAYLGEEMRPRSLALAMGLYVSGTGLGGLAGRLLAGAVTDVSGWRSALALTGLMGLACALLVWRFLPASQRFDRHTPDVRAAARGYAQHLRSHPLPWLCAEGFLVMGSFVTMFNYIGFRLMAPPYDLSQTRGASLCVVYLFGIAASTAMGALTARLGRHRLLLFSLLAMLGGTMLTGADAVWVVVSGLSLLAVGFFASHAVVSAWVGAVASGARAQASALYLCAYYMGASIVGSVGGRVWSDAGWPGVTSLTSGLLVAAVAVAWRLRPCAMDEATHAVDARYTPQERPC